MEWEDKNTLTEDKIEDFVKFIQIVSKKMKIQSQDKIVVHCKAGIGRSGVFIACIFIMDLLKYYLDIYGNFMKDVSLIEKH